ncbi:MAG: hypothetical protein AAF191_20885, partial [Verrucomicrobiota bacterium]
DLRKEDHMGNTIPMVMATTADGSAPILGFGYDQLKSDSRGAARDLREKLTVVDVIGGKGDEEDAGEGGEAMPATGEASPLLEEQEWTNAGGTAMTAAVLGLESGNVLFLMPDGREISYPLLRLSEDSRQAIEAAVDGKE